MNITVIQQVAAMRTEAKFLQRLDELDNEFNAVLFDYLDRIIKLPIIKSF